MNSISSITAGQINNLAITDISSFLSSAIIWFINQALPTVLSCYNLSHFFATVGGDIMSRSFSGCVEVQAVMHACGMVSSG